MEFSKSEIEELTQHIEENSIDISWHSNGRIDVYCEFCGNSEYTHASKFNDLTQYYTNESIKKDFKHIKNCPVNTAKKFRSILEKLKEGHSVLFEITDDTIKI